jgi:hypothetical protein
VIGISGVYIQAPYEASIIHPELIMIFFRKWNKFVPINRGYACAWFHERKLSATELLVRVQIPSIPFVI